LWNNGWFTLGEGTFGVLVDEPGRGHTMYDAPGVDAVCHFRGRHPGPGTVAEVEVISSEGSDIFVGCVPGRKAGPEGANR